MKASQMGAFEKGLEIFLDLLRSGHTDADQYLQAIVQKNEYVLLLPQVFKSIAFGHYSYYASHRSPVPNLFAPVGGVGSAQSYFTKAYFLNWVAMYCRVSTTAGVGFVSVTAAKVILGGLGLEEGSHIDAIAKMIDEEIIVPDIQMIDNPAAWGHIRITTKGLYLLRRMPNLFSYWEAVMLDTPITSTKVLTRICGLYQEATKTSLHQRVLCVREFLEFLEGAEAIEQVRVQSAGLKTECSPLMPVLMEQAKADFTAMEQEARENPYK